MSLLVLAVLVAIALLAYRAGRGRALVVAGGDARQLHSRPGYYGAYVALWCGLPSLLLLVLWRLFEGSAVEWLVIERAGEQVRSLSPERIDLFLRDVSHLAALQPTSSEPTAAMRAAAAHFSELHRLSTICLIGLALAISTGGLAVARSRITASFRARVGVERIVDALLLACSTVAILVTIGIVLSLVFEAARFFARVSVVEFLFGVHWSPQTALRADQVGSSGAFGAIPVFWGTLLITLIAMVVAVPIGLMSAIYLSEYATPRLRAWAKPLLEILAGVPTVVYGFFAALTVGPTMRAFGESLGMSVASESALAAGSVMGVMIIPFVSSLSDDVISAVPRSLREGSYGLGATQSETIRKVVVPAALPGIVASVLLAVSRAIGETMIVVMAAGLAANLTVNPLEAVTTVTVQIVTLLVGDQEFDSAKTLAAFALGLGLFVVTLSLNVIALVVVRRYREQYD
jgi:phosphate transport system permease protein